MLLTKLNVWMLTFTSCVARLAHKVCSYPFHLQVALMLCVQVYEFESNMLGQMAFTSPSSQLSLNRFLSQT